MKNDIMYVNINDIEDLITAKIQIDKDDSSVDGRSNLTEFIQKYCVLNYILTNNDKTIPFQILKLFNKQYLFYSSDNIEDLQLLIKILQPLKYDLSSLKPQPYTILLSNPLTDINDYYIVHNNQIYLL